MSPSTEAAQSVWLASLGVYAVVLIAVLVLLLIIRAEARKIHAGVSEIWNVGQKIANNTIHIALLDATNHSAGRILASAQGVAGATAAIRAHAESCPHCPSCALGGGS